MQNADRILQAMPSAAILVLESRMTPKCHVRFGGEGEETRLFHHRKVRLALTLLEVGSRRVHFAGCTTNPNATWVAQQARQMVWELEGRDPAIRFLIHDNDTSFTEAFDTVFRAEGIKGFSRRFGAIEIREGAKRGAEADQNWRAHT